MDAQNEYDRRPIEQLLAEFGSKSDEVLYLIRETAGLIAYYQRLLERFELDALTGLPGATKFRDFIDGAESRLTSVGVIFFDVNDLKFYNDTKGHQAGDLLLQKASESLHLVVGGHIRAFRAGGDEFVVLIENCAESEIDELLSKWKDGLDGLNSADDGIHCSVAVGAAFGEGKFKMSDVLKLADERMYTEKRRMKRGK
ncbi:MAG: GGDEF domain-containing protein [Defluviitaleaceae bacterium]|nr:GGDEF domain-containing protein [Defluviitaleaceae bacterium]